MRLAPAALLVLPSLGACRAITAEPEVKQPGSVSSITVLVGQRFLDSGDWEPLDEPIAVAVEFDSYGRFDPFGFEAGFSYAEDSATASGIDLDSETWELYAGLRKTFSLAEDRLHPYLSAGASWSTSEVGAGLGGSSAELDDDAFGFYVRAGAYWTFGRSFNLGLDYRKLLGADFEDSGVSADAGFDQVSLSIGYSF
ncbi:MAG: porin family protein [Planctomycetes bacterium]|nr:porin family protein [Planctomycetota bacterium]